MKKVKVLEAYQFTEEELIFIKDALRSLYYETYADAEKDRILKLFREMFKEKV